MDKVLETPWLTTEQQKIWRSFLGGSTVLLDRLDRDLRSTHGLSMPEYEILVRLSEAPGRAIRMAELAAAVSHSRSRVTHTIARLEREGRVTRGQCSEDGRGVSAVLTDSGLEPDDLAALGRIMQTVVEALQGRSF